MLYLFIGMARGRGRGKSSGRSNPAIRVSMPTIPKPTIVSPQQGGTPTNTSTQSISPTISETPPATSNQSNLIGQHFSTQSNSTGHTSRVAECESNSSHTRTLVFLTSAGLVHSFDFIPKLVSTYYIEQIEDIWIGFHYHITNFWSFKHNI